ncbi:MULTISPECIES: hypothetical protein [Arthrobacter]|uniref:Uncharacterized protein n=1 Tax=Arthrobacter terricola TaxID=2547396 RepID=A0A4R5KG30_9MICC|nr:MULTISPECIES: hypothetical protein [Arthrobacter]MBT8159662.1 hypothetical protein [Arthrobacter sp. GN70]TDF93618.1 hypothetical protein E1809_15375 [Arthrobacter terricola]
MNLWGTFRRIITRPNTSRTAESGRRESPGRLRAVVEPAVAGLVGAVVAELRAQGRTPLPVTDPAGRHWAPAYVLGTLHVPARHDGHAVAELVIDGSGRMVLDHPVVVTGSRTHPLPVNCPSLADAYEHLITRITPGHDPAHGPVFLTTGGTLMIDAPVSGSIPLADYLNALIQPPVLFPDDAPFPGPDTDSEVSGSARPDGGDGAGVHSGA